MIGANIVGINRLGLECCHDMRGGAQMEECEVDSHGNIRNLTEDVSLWPPHFFTPASARLTSKVKTLLEPLNYFYWTKAALLYNIRYH